MSVNTRGLVVWFLLTIPPAHRCEGVGAISATALLQQLSMLDPQPDYMHIITLFFVTKRQEGHGEASASFLAMSETFFRPSIAPQPSLDIRHIKRNPALYERNCVERNYKQLAQNPAKIAALAEQLQRVQDSALDTRRRSNEIQQLLKLRPDHPDWEGQSRASIIAEATEIKKKLQEVEPRERALTGEIERLAISLPNLSSVHTPVGNEPEVVGYINEHPDKRAGFLERSHVDIGAELGILDFKASAVTSGWGWYFLRKEGVMLEQALVLYAQSVAMRKGWDLVSPPSIVYGHIAAACGFQPRDQFNEEQIYRLQEDPFAKGKPSLVLTGTAEIPLAGQYAMTDLDESVLPAKFIGTSRCYRAEAGARGVDTKGLYRVHEFTKVEMFAFALPDTVSEEAFGTDAQQSSPSEAIFDEMLSMQTEILTSLGLHCRILEMPTTDLGASATRKRDIEAFFPSRRQKDEGWGEVTSTSICTDYQSRRLATRVRTKKESKLVFPHTVNGTALAVPRVLAAILENGWDEAEGCVRIPEVLRPFMSGLETINRPGGSPAERVMIRSIPSPPPKQNVTSAPQSQSNDANFNRPRAGSTSPSPRRQPFARGSKDTGLGFLPSPVTLKKSQDRAPQKLHSPSTPTGGQNKKTVDPDWFPEPLTPDVLKKRKGDT